MTLFATENLAVRVYPQAQEVQSVRYRRMGIEEFPWIELEELTDPLSLDEFASEKELVALQQTFDGQVWGTTWKFQFDPLQSRWSLFDEAPSEEPTVQYFEPYSLDLGGSTYVPFGRFSTYYRWGVGAQVHGTYKHTPSSHSSVFSSFEYLYGFPVQHGIQRVSAFHTLAIDIGFSYDVNPTALLQLSLQIGGGIQTLLAQGDIYRRGVDGVDLFWEPYLFFGPKLIIPLQNSELTLMSRISMTIRDDLFTTGVVDSGFSLIVGTRFSLPYKKAIPIHSEALFSEPIEHPYAMIRVVAQTDGVIATRYRLETEVDWIEVADANPVILLGLSSLEDVVLVIEQCCEDGIWRGPWYYRYDRSTNVFVEDSKEVIVP